MLIVGSGSGMPGAVRLSGEACPESRRRAGDCGCCPGERPRRSPPVAPSFICLQLTAADVLAEAIEKAEVIAIRARPRPDPGRARRSMQY